MSYSENGGTPFTMPVAPYGGGYGNNGFLGGDGAWWLLVLLLFGNNGWGNGFGGGGNGVQAGFNQAALTNGQNEILQSLNNNQIATLQGFNTMGSAFQNCCCENRLGIADLKYTVATENCADRQVVNDIGRDLITAGTANTQAIINSTSVGFNTIMDKICQLELDGKNAQIAELQAQLNEANRRASQNDQTAAILAGQRTIANEVEQYLNPTPRPAWIVQNPNCCANYGYGCGCGQ